MLSFEEAKSLHERGQIADAIQAYDALLNKNFGSVDVLFYYGTALFQQGKTGLAATVLKQVIETTPTMQSAYQNLGNCFKIEQKKEEAEDVYKMGLKLGDDAELYAALGGLYINRHQPLVALENYKKALAMDPRNDLIRFNMGLAYLELGDWDKGLEYYELGFAAGNRADRQYKNLPKWDGTPGKTVILWGEQGLGDEIMFGSCLVDAIKNCKRVIWDCHPRLTDTFKRSFPEIECYGTRKNHYLEWFDKCDAEAHASITTAASFYRKKVEDFPGTPFLKADPAEVTKYREGAKRLRVGISWAGGSKMTNTDLRSVPLEKWKPILEQDCDFFSLQYTPNASKEVCDLDQKLGIHLHHYPDLVESYNYDKTINFMASMDVIITVCTTLHQAAGALGLPTWTLVPYMPAWRYGLSGTTSPWYKSAKMFRQKKDDTWGPVINQVSEELEKANK
jgi:tetratricopeptide (TPR) repeat protein